MLSLRGACETSKKGKAGSLAKSPVWILIRLRHSINLLCILPLNLEILQKINYDSDAVSAKRKVKSFLKTPVAFKCAEVHLQHAMSTSQLPLNKNK